LTGRQTPLRRKTTTQTHSAPATGALTNAAVRRTHRRVGLEHWRTTETLRAWLQNA
jgi:hypothetical protein